MGDSEKLTGLEALEAKLNQIESGETDEENLEDSTEEVKAEVNAEAEIKAEEEGVSEEKPKVEEEEGKEAESEIEAKSELKEISAEGETKQEENIYSPNYQYKFQDEFFEFDERVKSAVKSPEDEEYFRDLYTKSRAMEIYKGRTEETIKERDDYKSKYSEVEVKANEGEKIVEYFSSVLDGINRGDVDHINQLFSLSKVNKKSLEALGEVIVQHLEDPQGFNNTVQQNRMQYEQQNVQKQSSEFEQRQVELAREKTQFEVHKAINDPELSELVNYVDGTWGAGTFEKRVWSEGESRESAGKTVTLTEIPNIVKEVADWFGKAKPQSTASSEQPTPEVKATIEKKIVENPAQTLPNLKGDRGVPEKPVYKDGSGVEGLASRYKEITGNDW